MSRVKMIILLKNFSLEPSLCLVYPPLVPYDEVFWDALRWIQIVVLASIPIPSVDVLSIPAIVFVS